MCACVLLCERVFVCARVIRACEAMRPSTPDTNNTPLLPLSLQPAYNCPQLPTVQQAQLARRRTGRRRGRCRRACTWRAKRTRCGAWWSGWQCRACGGWWWVLRTDARSPSMRSWKCAPRHATRTHARTHARAHYSQEKAHTLTAHNSALTPHTSQVVTPDTRRVEGIVSLSDVATYLCM